MAARVAGAGYSSAPYRASLGHGAAWLLTEPGSTLPCNAAPGDCIQKKGGVLTEQGVVETWCGVARVKPPWELYRSVQFSIQEQLLYRNVQRFRGGLVFEAHRLCVSLNSRLESNKEEEEVTLGIPTRAVVTLHEVSLHKGFLVKSLRFL